MYQDAKKRHLFEDKQDKRISRSFFHTQREAKGGKKILDNFFLCELHYCRMPPLRHRRQLHHILSALLVFMFPDCSPVKRESRRQEPGSQQPCCEIAVRLWTSILSHSHPPRSRSIDFIQCLGIICKVLWALPTEATSRVYNIIGLPFGGRRLQKKIYVLNYDFRKGER